MIRPLKSLVEHAAERGNIRTIPKITLIKLKAIQKSQTTCFKNTKTKKGSNILYMPCKGTPQPAFTYYAAAAAGAEVKGEKNRRFAHSKTALDRVIRDRSQYIDLLRAFAMELTSEQAEILKAFKTDAGADKRFFSFNRNSVNLPFCSCARISE